MAAVWAIPRFFVWFAWYERALWKWCGSPPLVYTAANAFTIFRGKVSLYVVPVLYALYVATDNARLLAAAFALIVASAASDWVDGLIARILGCESACGRYLDPAADSINVFIGYNLILAEYGWPGALVVPVFAIVLLGLAIFFLRVIADARTHWLARLAILCLYLSGLSFIAHILVMKGVLPVTLWRMIGPFAWGFFLLWGAFILMGLSTIWYMRLASTTYRKIAGRSPAII